jgi:LysR family hydrogen peroxide-inducible transcriptional activator
LEEELGFKIFDRTKQPVLPTEYGLTVIEHAKKIIAERNTLHEVVAAKKGIINGELKLGIITTLAPYLLPLFVQPFIKKYPKAKTHY